MTNAIEPCAEFWKFRGFNTQFKDILKNKELWFSTPQSFNDPFDCQVDIASTFSDVRYSLHDHLDDEFSEMVSTVERRIKATRYAYLCLCKEWNQSLMWSHYADNHKGVALGFTFDTNSPFKFGEMTYGDITYKASALRDQLALVNNAFGMFQQYRPGTPGLMAGEAQKFISDFQNSLLRLYKIVRFMKAECWVYEEEFRFELELEGKDFKAIKRPFANSDLKHVLFGTLFEPDYEQEVKELLSSPDWSHVQYWRSKRDSVNLVLTAERID